MKHNSPTRGHQWRILYQGKAIFTATNPIGHVLLSYFAIDNDLTVPWYPYQIDQAAPRKLNAIPGVLERSGNAHACAILALIGVKSFKRIACVKDKRFLIMTTGTMSS